MDERLLKLIEKKKCGRKIVSWGGFEKDNEVIKNIEEYLGEKVHFFVSVQGENISEQIFNIGKIKEKALDYLVVCFPKETEEIQKMFENFKYTKNDVIYVNPMVDYTKRSVDQYENVVSALTSNINLVIKGWGNVVEIGNVQCDKKVNLIINGDGAEIVIKDDVVFKNDCLISVISNEDSKAHLFIDENVTFCGDALISVGNGIIQIGKNCTFNSKCNMYVHNHYIIEIDDDCMCSKEVLFLCGDCHNIYDVESKKCINFGKQLSQRKRCIKIKEHVWIGIRSTILSGTYVGQGSIIGACSVVKGKYPNNVAIGGNIAKIVKKNIAWDRNMIPAEGLIDTLEDKYIKKTLQEPSDI